MALAERWQEWSDGRPWRLKAGRDFDGTLAAMAAEAVAAAERLGNVVVTVPERMGKTEYLWVQFADAYVDPSGGCVCGAVELERVHEQFARCRRCGRQLIIRLERKSERGEETNLAERDVMVVGSEDEPRLASIGAVRVLDQTGDERSEVPVDAPVFVEVEMSALEPGVALRCLVTFYVDGIVAFRAVQREEVIALRPQKYSARLTIPARLLSTRTYHLKVTLMSRLGDAELDLARKAAATITVKETEPPINRWGNYRDGALSPWLEWEISELAAAEAERA